MSQQKDVILHNDDDISLEYVLLILNKVFGIPRQQGTKLAMDVERLGSAVVFTGSAEEVQQKLARVEMYNASSSNHLKMTSEDHGVFQASLSSEVSTSGTSLTMQLTSFVPNEGVLLGYIQKANVVGNLGLSLKQRLDMVRDLYDGKEVLLKDFGFDPQAQIKAELLKDLIESSLGLDGSDADMYQEEIDNIAFSIRPPKYTLAGSNKLMSERDMEKRALLGVIGKFGGSIFGSSIGDKYNQQIVEKYRSVENFLRTAPQSEIDDYNEIQTRLGKPGDVIEKKKNKHKP